MARSASARRAAKLANAEAKRKEDEAKRAARAQAKADKEAEAETKRATAKAELEKIGNEIAARVNNVRKYDAAAEEKAGYELRKAQDERDTINNVLLVQARAKCKEAGESFEKFRKQYCPDLSRSRLYVALAIADGRKTVEQDRAEKRESVAKSRAKGASSTWAVGDTPRVTGTDIDTEASAEARKEAASEPEPCDAGNVSAPDDVTVNHITASTIIQKPGAIATADELSVDALSSFKKACDQFLPAMTVPEDRRKARVYFMNACDALDKKARMEAA
jgi:hypothetical protein